MEDEKKFVALKGRLVTENEITYGKEAREKYGDGAVEAANANLMGMTREQYDAWNALDAELRQRLETSVKVGILPDSQEGREIYDLHRRWLSMTMKDLTHPKHKGIAQLYVLDQRFTAYYDGVVSGCAQLLRDAVEYWAK